MSEPKCDDDFFCGECPDCLSGDDPANRPRRDRPTPEAVHPLSAVVPVLRLTGEQIGSIEPPLSDDWFTDWDEYEEFVPKRLYDAAVAQPPDPDARTFDKDGFDERGVKDGIGPDPDALREALAALEDADLQTLREVLALRPDLARRLRLAIDRAALAAGVQPIPSEPEAEA